MVGYKISFMEKCSQLSLNHHCYPLLSGALVLLDFSKTDSLHLCANDEVLVLHTNTRGYQKVLSLTWKEPEIWIYSALFFNVVPFQLHTLVPSSFPVINTRSVEVNILVP